MTFSVVPETIEEFERQFGRERIAAAAAECGILTTSPRSRLSDDQRRQLFQRLVGVSVESTTGLRQVPQGNALPPSGTKANPHAGVPAPNAQARSTIANPSTASSPSEASVDTARLLQQIHEERVARANLEKALREQRSLAEALSHQIKQRDSELQQMADAERHLHQELSLQSARLQSLQRIADESTELRAELRSQAAVIAASSRHQIAEVRTDTLRAEIKALRREADKAEKLHFEKIRQQAQIAELKQKIDALKAQLRTANSRKAAATNTRPRPPAATKPSNQPKSAGDIESSAALDLLLVDRVQVWARQQAKAAQRFVPPKAVAVAGDGPMPSNALESLLQSRGIELVPIGDPRAAVLVVGRDHWEVDQIEEQIKARSGKDLFVHSQEMLLTMLLLGADPFLSGRNGKPDAKLMQAFADGHPALQCCIEEGFQWPRIPTATIARMLDPPPETAEESPLHKLGYRVGKTDGVPEKKRRDILECAFHGSLPPVKSRDYMKGWGTPKTRRRLRRMVTAIDWSIVKAIGRQRERGHDMSQAIDEWSGDLEWMHQSLYESWMHFRWPDTRVRGGRQHASVRKASARSRVAPTANTRKAARPDYRRALRFK
jgi:hypothetical protein